MRRWVVGAIGLGGLGCGGMPFAVVRAQGGGVVHVDCTGHLVWSAEVPGGTYEQLGSVKLERFAEWRSSGSDEQLRINAFGDLVRYDTPSGPQSTVRVELWVRPDGSLQGTLGSHHLEGAGAPVDLRVPGETTLLVRIEEHGVEAPIGESTCRVSWALDPAVTRWWLREKFLPNLHSS